MTARDPMAQLRAAQPMPRGERLARNRNVPAPKPHRLIQRCSQTLAMAWFVDDVETHAAPLALARERRRRERAEFLLALANAELSRHRQVVDAFRREIASVEALRADVIEYEAQMHAARGEAAERLAQARYWREQAKAAEAERDALRRGHTCREGDRVDCPACDAYVRRLAGPTRAEVEAAVDALVLDVRLYEGAHTMGRENAILDARHAKFVAARAALVALATRGRT